jgi:hypothetical protein
MGPKLVLDSGAWTASALAAQWGLEEVVRWALEQEASKE